MLRIRSFAADPADADDARCLGSDCSLVIQLMLMMRSALGSDGSQMCGAWDQIVHRISSLAADPADADDAQCFGSDRSKLIQLMLMMCGAWDQIGRSMMRVLGIRLLRWFTANPADADDARCFGIRWLADVRCLEPDRSQD